MKILLVANYLPDSQESMHRFAASMSAGLSGLGHSVRVIRPSVSLHRRVKAPVLRRWVGYIDKLIVFPAELKATLDWPDVVHICDHSNSFYVRYLMTKPHLVTCHDMLAIRSALGEIPKNRTRWTGRRLQQMILNGLQQAQHIVCVSNATKADLLRISGIRETRVSRIDNGLNHPYSPMPTDKASGLLSKLGVISSQPFILHVGGNQWYKNRPGVLRIFSSLRLLTPERDFRLVMAGKPWTSEMHNFVHHNGLQAVVTEVTQASNEELQALYSTAALLLFPSLEEGFGWPIVEAQACGCPVVTSNRAPMNAIAGESAIYVDPHNAEEAALTILNNLSHLGKARTLGLRNAERFGSSQMISAYADVYRELITEMPSQEPDVPIRLRRKNDAGAARARRTSSLLQ